MTEKAVELLKRLITIPSFSREESGTAALLHEFLNAEGADVRTCHNNVWAVSKHFDRSKPTLLLNSHHDTVKPSGAYTRDPFSPDIEGDRLYGLGSNDAGASAVALASVFCRMHRRDLPFNLLLGLTAEEEVMGEHGIREMLPIWADEGIDITMAIVGEPTGMDAAIGERGLVVLDCTAHARGGHAARTEGENALYKAVDDIGRLRDFKLPRRSELLGDIKVTVTQINAGRQHNVLPEECRFVVDVRTTDAYTNEQTVELLRSAITSDATPRSTRIRASAISASHPLVKAAVACGSRTYVSPTTSDMASMPDIPSLKIGIGDSARSHTADEWVGLTELADGLRRYEQILLSLANQQNRNNK